MPLFLKPEHKYAKFLCLLVFFIIFIFPYAALANVDCKSSGAQCVAGDTLPVYCPPGMNQFPGGDCSNIGSHPYVACCRGTAETGTSDVTGTKVQPKPGLGAIPCGEGQLYVDGNLSFTDCLSEADCAANRGRIDGGKNKAGCPEDQPLYCCIMKKNRCNDSSRLPTKIYLCTTDSQCTANSGAVFAGGPSGCGTAYPICCEFKDSPDNKTPMLNLGEPLQGLSGATGGRTSQVSRVARKYQNINAFCFTEVECAKASGAGAWVQGQGCPSKGNTPQGYCKAPVPEYSLQYPLGGVKTISGLKNFIALIFNYGMSIIIIVAAVLFIYGGFRYLFSAIANDIQTAKTIMMDSAIGLALGLSAYAILANVNFNTINLRSFDVFMINKMSFYDALYCKDVKPAAGKTEVKLQDAGTPFAPTELNITKGYPLSLGDTKCGEEYFIEGSDSLSVCSGSGCGGKGICLNCSAGTSNCRSSSEREHACFDANVGGTILFPGNERLTINAGNRKMQAFVFCETGSVMKFDQVGAKNPIVDVKTDKTLVSGLVSTYDIKLNLAKIKAFKDTCAGKSGLILEHHITAGNNGWWYYYLTKSCDLDYNKTEMFFWIKYLEIDSAFKAMSPDKRQQIFDDAWSLDDVLASDKSPIMCNVTVDIPSTVADNDSNRHY